MKKISFQRLPARHGAVLMPLILSGVMTFVVSAISTVKALGFTPAALQSWPGAWGVSWLVAFPTLLLVLPLVRRMVAALLLPQD